MANVIPADIYVVVQQLIDSVNRKLALTGSIYDSVQAGLGGTVAGQYFTVVSPTADNYMEIYFHAEENTATFVDSYPNKTALDQAVAEATTQADIAATEAADALTARQGSEAARAASETAQGLSETARDKAQLWADEAVDIQVEPGLYSALHYAEYANRFANAAVDSEVEPGLFSALHHADLARRYSSEAEDVVVAEGIYSALHHSAKALAQAVLAEQSRTQTEALRDSTETLYDDFRNRFLGSYTTANEPTVSTDGGPLSEGSFYFNVSTDELRVYDGTGWRAPATEALSSADAAAASETASAASEAAAATSETNAATSETNAATSEANASASEIAAEAAQTASETAQGISEGARDRAQQWANEPEDAPVEPGLYSALHHSTKASQQRVLAEQAQAATAQLKTDVQIIFDNFDDRFLGSFDTANEPTTDNDGNPILVGAIYYNTDETELRFYNGAAWEAPTAAAANSATQASNSASAAATSETNAADSAAAALVSENNAGLSETNAATSEANAATSEANASDSEVAAEAAQAATEAARDLTADYLDQFNDQYLGAFAEDPATDNDGDPLTTGTIYFNSAAGELRYYDGASFVAPTAQAAQSASEAAQSATAAATSEDNASASEAAAAASEAAADTSETNAATSAGNAATSETNAASSETNAAASAANASTSETNAAQSATDAATTLDTFEEVFLGAYADEPTQTPNGNAISDGMIYVNTTSNKLFIRVGGVFVETAFDPSNVSITGGSVNVGTLTVSGATVYHTNNTGPESGLDADLVDGIEGSRILLNDTEQTISGSFNINAENANFRVQDPVTGAKFKLFQTGDDTFFQANKTTGDSGSFYFSGYNAANVTDFFIRAGDAWQTVWHAGNDGSGSGLDADLLDGVQASFFMRKDIANTINGPLTIQQSFPQVLLQTTDDQGQGRIYHDAGSLVLRAAASDTDDSGTIRFSGENFVDLAELSVRHSGGWRTIWHEGNDGPGSGLNADAVDGLHANEFAQRTNLNTFTENNTFQGQIRAQGYGDSYINYNPNTATQSNYLTNGENGFTRFREYNGSAYTTLLTARVGGVDIYEDLSVTGTITATGNMFAFNALDFTRDGIAYLQSKSHLYFTTNGSTAAILYSGGGLNGDLAMVTRTTGDNRYVQRTGSSMSGNINMGNNSVTDLRSLHFDGSGFSGDYVDWETTQGMRFFENGSFKARVGPASEFVDDIKIQGGRPFHSGRGNNEVGSIIFARSSSGVTNHDTVGGSSLTPSDANNSSFATRNLSGTWRCLGASSANVATLFVRIS